MSIKNFILSLVFLFAFGGQLMAQCAVDVTITQGASIEMCEEAPVPISGSNGYVTYNWTGPETLSGQTITPQFSGVYTLEGIDGTGCSSFANIQVTINPSPTPTIISSEGNPICAVPGGTTLSTGTAYVSYDWGGGNTGPTFFASGPGAYALTVVDNNGCTGHDVISITEHNFTLVQTETSGCSGTAVMLSAGGGATYLWSTGETGSSIVVAPNSATNYSVTATIGTCSETLNTTVQPVQELDFDLGDTLFLEAGESASIAGPSNFASYLWTPGEMVDDSLSPVATFTGDTSFVLSMTATHSSGCQITDALVVIVLNLTIPNGFSPNGDNYNEYFIIPELYTLQGSLMVWNRWGDVVLNEPSYQNDWNGTCRTSFCAGKEALPQGTYYYQLVVEGVTSRGYITLKR